MVATGDVTLGLVREALGFPASLQLDEQLTAVGSDALWQSAQHHRVTALVHGPLDARHNAVGDDTLSRYMEAYVSARVLESRLLSELAVVAHALDGADLRWLILKGPALAEVVYTPAQLRSYSDIDVLVARQDFRRAVSALEGAGYSLFDVDWAHWRRNQASEVQLRRPSEGRPTRPTIDLHWDVVWHDRDREQFSIPIDDVIRDARRLEIADVDALIPNPCDSLLLVCLHACLEGADRLIWLCDVDRLVAGGIDWHEVVTKARAWRVGLPVGTLLLRTKSTIGTSIPADVLDELVGSRAWLGVLKSLDAIFPVQRVMGPGTPATLVARTSRGDIATTLKLFGPRFVRRLWTRLRPHADRPAAGTDDRERGTALVDETKSGAARSAFFADFDERAGPIA